MEKDMDDIDFGIGVADNLGDKSNAELFDLLAKTRSKVFDNQGKVIRQTLSAEEKLKRKVEKILANSDLSLDEQIALVEKLKKGEIDV